MDKKAWLINTFPQGTPLFIAAAIQHCRKCQAKFESRKADGTLIPCPGPCPKCGDKDPLTDIRFPRGLRAVVVNGDPQYFLDWAIPWRDNKTKETGFMLIEWAYSAAAVTPPIL